MSVSFACSFHVLTLSVRCVSEFISFITSEASDRCLQEKRKTINGNVAEAKVKISFCFSFRRRYSSGDVDTRFRCLRRTIENLSDQSARCIEIRSNDHHGWRFDRRSTYSSCSSSIESSGRSDGSSASGDHSSSSESTDTELVVDASPIDHTQAEWSNRQLQWTRTLRTFGKNDLPLLLSSLSLSLSVSLRFVWSRVFEMTNRERIPTMSTRFNPTNRHSMRIICLTPNIDHSFTCT